MGSFFLYFAGDRLSRAELSAARLDGDLIEVGEAYMPTDAVETRELRAASLAPLLRGTLAATHASAAWVHGALAVPPHIHSVQRVSARRTRPVLDSRVHYQDSRIDPDDVVLIAGVAVSTDVRTLVDLARSPEHAHRAAARALAVHDPGLVDSALGWLAASGPVRDKRTAVELLRSLRTADQDDVTR